MADKKFDIKEGLAIRSGHTHTEVVDDSGNWVGPKTQVGTGPQGSQGSAGSPGGGGVRGLKAYKDLKARLDHKIAPALWEFKA